MKEYNIGRYPEADIILSSNFCSRDHAKITLTEGGKILFQDYSTNGSIVNGRKISNQTIEVKHGDEVLFGGVERLDWNKIEKPLISKREEQKKENTTQRLSFFKHHIIKAVVVLVLVVIVTAIIRIYYSSSEREAATVFTATEIYNRYKNAVAMFEVKYYVRIQT